MLRQMLLQLCMQIMCVLFLVCAVADAVDSVYVDAACVAVTVCAGAGVCRYYGCFLLLMFMMYCKCLG